MKRIAIALLLIAFPTFGHSTLPPIPVNIICTVQTLGRPQSCHVEMWGSMSGVRIDVKSLEDAEELVAVLEANSGRDYQFLPEYWFMKRRIKALKSQVRD